jgi:hypothetical protein
MEHPLDRLFRRIRPAIYVAAIIAAPIFVFTYASAMAAYAVPLGWWGVGVIIAQVLGWIAIGSLFDDRQERRTAPEAGQSPPHPRP